MTDEEQIVPALFAAMNRLNLLIRAAPESRIPKLVQQAEKLQAEIERLAAAILDRNDARYKAATAQLRTAATHIQDALDDMGKVARAIQTLGRALELAATVAP